MKIIRHITSTHESSGSTEAAPLFLRQLSPEMRARVLETFWCDFSDIVPKMAWDDADTAQ